MYIDEIIIVSCIHREVWRGQGREGRPMKNWHSNVEEWTGSNLVEAGQATFDR